MDFNRYTKLWIIAIFFSIAFFGVINYVFPQKLAKTILEKHTEAMGGKEKWESLESYEMVFIKPDAFTLTISCIMPNKIQLRFQKEDQDVYKVYDGENGFIIQNGVRKPMRPGEVTEMAEEPQFYSELMFANDLGYQISYLGKEQLDEINCYKIKVDKSDVDEQMYWINTETYLIEQTGEYSEDRVHEGIYYKTRLLDYRLVDGYLFPFQQILYPSNKMPISSIVHNIRVNFDLSAPDFPHLKIQDHQ